VVIGFGSLLLQFLLPAVTPSPVSSSHRGLPRGKHFIRLLQIGHGRDALLLANGRKSRSVLVDGDIRHVLHDLDTGLIRAVGITLANAPEARVTEAISEDLKRQEICLNDPARLVSASWTAWLYDAETRLGYSHHHKGLAAFGRAATGSWDTLARARSWW